jgi:hypothetical protein
LVVCEECGGLFWKNATAAKLLYYWCAGQLSTIPRADRCRARKLHADRVDELVWKAVRTLFEDPHQLKPAIARVEPFIMEDMSPRIAELDLEFKVLSAQYNDAVRLYAPAELPAELRARLVGQINGVLHAETVLRARAEIGRVVFDYVIWLKKKWKVVDIVSMAPRLPRGGKFLESLPIRLVVPSNATEPLIIELVVPTRGSRWFPHLYTYDPPTKSRYDSLPVPIGLLDEKTGSLEVVFDKAIVQIFS